MITFSFRATVDRDPKWGECGRWTWRSDCGSYRIEQHLEFMGVRVRPRERYLAIRNFGDRVLGRTSTRKAAIALCERDVPNTPRHVHGQLRKADREAREQQAQQEGNTNGTRQGRAGGSVEGDHSPLGVGLEIHLD